jgi:transposase, IS30 family
MKGYKRISIEERVEIATLLSSGLSKAEVARRLNRSRSTISREMGIWTRYDPLRSDQLSKERVSRHNKGNNKIQKCSCLRGYIHKQIRLKWSPVQISKSLASLYPKDKHMQISHESIYTYIYLLGRGALKKELIEGLRQQKSQRYSRKGIYAKRGGIADMISIEERPMEVADRSIAGHWEGDLIVGKGHKTALGVIVERKTRTVILAPLTAKDAYSVREAFERELATLPLQMKKSMTYDNGKEMSQHKLFTANTQMQVYFCHPHSPWERGTCENTNGLIRQYFPKGTDFSKVTVDEIKTAQHQLNERPRKTLNWKTPKDVFEEEILLNCI